MDGRTRDGQELVDTALAQVGGRASGHHHAALQDRVAPTGCHREIDELLHQQRGDALARQLRDNLLDLVHDGRLNPLGRLVQQHDFRARHQRPRDRQLLLLAAAQGAGRSLAHLRQHWEQRVHLLKHRAALGGFMLGRASNPISKFSKTDR